MFVSEKVYVICLTWLLLWVLRRQIQRKLQVRIEEQGKRLQKMFEDQLKVSGNTAPAAGPDVVLFPAAAETPSDQEEDAVFVDVIDDDDEVQIISVASGSYDDDLAL